jgi:hypothetical protein
MAPAAVPKLEPTGDNPTLRIQRSHQQMRKWIPTPEETEGPQSHSWIGDRALGSYHVKEYNQNELTNDQIISVSGPGQ